ncbi:MAG: YdcF family protein [Pirellulales bacterium]
MSQCKAEQACCGISRVTVHYCLTIISVAFGVVLIATAFEGRFGFEKSLTGLVMPVGFLWLNLTAVMLSGWIGRWSRTGRISLTVAWLLMSALTTSPLPDKLYSFLETTLEGEFRPGADPPLDVVVVFGGGTQMGPYRPEVGEAGDRLVYAAQLFHGGYAKQLLATGHGADVETVTIWRNLAIPKDRISTIEGRNTFEEITNLVQWLKQQGLEDTSSGKYRIGIVSSAYHLPRIQRLANKAGLHGLIPVAAHHRVSPNSYSVLDFIPSLGPLAKFGDFQREMMGRLVGR